MNTLQASQAEYIKYYEENKRIKDKIEERKLQIERLKKKRSRLYEKSFWGDILIRPIMEEVKKKYPTITWDDDRLVPMGMKCRVSLFGKIQDVVVASIVFVPTNLSEGKMNFETGKRIEGYHPSSIGSLNGFDMEEKEIESLEDIFNHIDNQILKYAK